MDDSAEVINRKQRGQLQNIARRVHVPDQSSTLMYAASAPAMATTYTMQNLGMSTTTSNAT